MRATLRVKLSIALLSACAVGFLLSGQGYFALGFIESKAREVSGHSTRIIRTVTELQQIVGRLQFVAISGKQAHQSDIADLAAQLHVALSEYGTEVDVDERDRALYDQVTKSTEQLWPLLGRAGSPNQLQSSDIAALTELGRVLALALEEELVQTSDNGTKLLEVIDTTRRTMILVGCLSLVMVLFLIVVLVRSITTPIHRLRDAAVRIGGGDFESRAVIGTGDEFEDLGNAFNRMADQLSKTTVSRGFLHDLLDSLNDGVLVLSSPGDVLYRNFIAASFGLDAHNVAQGEGYHPHITTLNDRVLKISTGTWKAGTRQSPGTIYVAADLTTQTVLEREVAAFRDRLASNERLNALGTLGAIVGHKLSQPISTVRLFLSQIARSLSQTNLPPGVAEKLTECSEELTRTSEMVKLMLRAAGQTPPAPEPVSLAEVCGRTVRAFEERLHRTGATVRIDNLDGLPPVSGSPSLLEEGFYILISNALQAAPEGSCPGITISAAAVDNLVHISVADNCQGIPPEHLDRVFDLFFTTKGQDRGTGLGLAILKRIVEQHGGTVRVSSVVGSGTTFTLELPRFKDHGTSTS